jgi:lipopolysaccharide/colanic/teichoic acid biosynthesis glycosyltransferase
LTARGRDAVAAASPAPRPGVYLAFVKRPIDVVVSAGAMVVLAPLLAAIAVLVRGKLGRPVLFTQVRPGRYGRPFRMVKFRSMTDERGPDGELVPDAQRLPPFGRFLRASSLDELPELWNVLMGDMSLVGPRPLLVEYLPLYSPAQARRHEVRPGITGLAQVNGRNALSWEERFDLDRWYVDHPSFHLDLRIVVLTIARVAGSAGVTEAGGATMTRFGGTIGPEPSR